jgi:hypothetical protein
MWELEAKLAEEVALSLVYVYKGLLMTGIMNDIIKNVVKVSNIVLINWIFIIYKKIIYWLI